MGQHSPFFESAFTARNTLEEAHPLLKCVPRLDVDQIGAGDTVLGDRDRASRSFKVGEKTSGLSLQRGDEFGAHEVILKWHSRQRNATRPLNQTNWVRGFLRKVSNTNIGFSSHNREMHSVHFLSSSRRSTNVRPPPVENDSRILPRPTSHREMTASATGTPSQTPRRSTSTASALTATIRCSTTHLPCWPAPTSQLFPNLKSDERSTFPDSRSTMPSGFSSHRPRRAPQPSCGRILTKARLDPVPITSTSSPTSPSFVFT